MKAKPHRDEHFPPPHTPPWRSPWVDGIGVPHPEPYPTGGWPQPSGNPACALMLPELGTEVAKIIHYFLYTDPDQREISLGLSLVFIINSFNSPNKIYVTSGSVDVMLGN